MSSESGATETKPFFRTSAEGKMIIERLRKGSDGEDGSAIGDAMDLVKLAVALSIAKGIRSSKDDRLKDASNGMSWGISQFDADGTLKRLVAALYFGDANASPKDVYVTAEILADEGLRLLDLGRSEGRTIAQVSCDVD